MTIFKPPKNNSIMAFVKNFGSNLIYFFKAYFDDEKGNNPNSAQDNLCPVLVKYICETENEENSAPN